MVAAGGVSGCRADMLHQSNSVRFAVQENLALDFELSSEDMDILSELQDQCRQHDNVWPIEPMFKQFFQPVGPWPSRAELWDDHVTYASLQPGEQ